MGAKKTAKKKAVRKSGKGRSVARKNPEKQLLPKAPLRRAKSRKAEKVKLPPGRPTVCTEAAALLVLQRIMEGDCLDRACELENVPCKRTWLRWVAVDVSLQSRYVAAMQIRALSLAEDCVPIADEVREEKGALLKANLRIRTRQWMIMRLQNKVYGKDGVIAPPPSLAGDHAAMSDPEIELRLKSLRDEVKR